MDTVYPAYHIFREEYLSRVDEFKRDGFKFDMCLSVSDSERIPNKKEETKSLPRRFFSRLKRSVRGKRK